MTLSNVSYPTWNLWTHFVHIIHHKAKCTVLHGMWLHRRMRNKLKSWTSRDWMMWNLIRYGCFLLFIPKTLPICSKTSKCCITLISTWTRARPTAGGDACEKQLGKAERKTTWGFCKVLIVPFNSNSNLLSWVHSFYAGLFAYAANLIMHFFLHTSRARG